MASLSQRVPMRPVIPEAAFRPLLRTREKQLFWRRIAFDGLLEAPCRRARWCAA